MATFSQLLGIQSGVPSRTTSGDTLDFTGYTLTGVSATAIGDGTGNLGFDGSGNLSSTGIVALDLDASGALAINSSGGGLFLGNDAVNQPIDIGTGGTRTITLGSANATLDVNAAGVTLDATTLSIDSTDTSNLSMTANSVSGKTLTIAAANGGTGAANIAITAKNAFSVDAAGFSLDATSVSSNVTVTGANLTVSTATSGDLALTSAGTATFGDATGSLAWSSAGLATLTLATNNANGLVVKDTAGSPVTYFTVQTLTGNPAVLFSAAPTLVQQTGATPLAQAITAGATFSAGDVLAVNGTSGRYAQADANGTGTLRTVTGIAVASGTSGNPSAMAIGGIANVTFTGTAPATTDIGQFAFLSETAGAATLTAPSASGSRVYKIGIIVNANGTSTAQVLVQPQFLYDVL